MAKERKVKKVQARHILVGAKELADELKEKIDQGEEFTKLAEEHSEVPVQKTRRRPRMVWERCYGSSL